MRRRLTGACEMPGNQSHDGLLFRTKRGLKTAATKSSGNWYIRIRTGVVRMKTILTIQSLLLIVSVSACLSGGGDSTGGKGSTMEFKVSKPDSLWRKELSPEAYDILREKGTERAFTGEY